jgi:hypothetical protein
VAFVPGTRLGIYEITAPIGEGGMGEVYRATDTRLKRQVAIKVLPASLAADHSTIVYESNVTGHMELYRKRSDGAETEVQLTRPDGSSKWPTSVAPDGKALLYLVIPPKTGNDKGTGLVSGCCRIRSDRPARCSHVRFSERLPTNRSVSSRPTGAGSRTSPTSRVAMKSTPCHFPGPGGKRQISVNGGTQPRWRRDGRELFFLREAG